MNQIVFLSICLRSSCSQPIQVCPVFEVCFCSQPLLSNVTGLSSVFFSPSLLRFVPTSIRPSVNFNALIGSNNPPPHSPSRFCFYFFHRHPDSTIFPVFDFFILLVVVFLSSRWTSIHKIEQHTFPPPFQVAPRDFFPGNVPSVSRNPRESGASPISINGWFLGDFSF